MFLDLYVSYLSPERGGDSGGRVLFGRQALDRGLSDIDHPFATSISYVWDIPKMHGGDAFLRGVVNGWSMSGLIQRHSGDS